MVKVIGFNRIYIYQLYLHSFMFWMLYMIHRVERQPLKAQNRIQQQDFSLIEMSEVFVFLNIAFNHIYVVAMKEHCPHSPSKNLLWGGLLTDMTCLKLQNFLTEATRPPDAPRPEWLSTVGELEKGPLDFQVWSSKGFQLLLSLHLPVSHKAQASASK